MFSLLITCVLNIFAFTTDVNPDPNPPAKINIEEFKSLNGLYKGTLTYTDYTGGEVVSLQLVSNIWFKGNEMKMQHLINEWGQAFEQNHEYKFKDEGIIWGKELNIIEKTNENGAMRLVTEVKGKDGNKNRPCTYRVTFNSRENMFSITKEVKFDDEEEFFIRNQYHFQKLANLTDAEKGFKEF